MKLSRFFLFAIITLFLIIKINTFSPKFGVAHQWNRIVNKYINNDNNNEMKNLRAEISSNDKSSPSSTNLEKNDSSNKKVIGGNDSFKEFFFNAKIDNFNISQNYMNNSFKLRYLVDNTYYSKGGPILFYCGNEGPIEDFYEATGFIHEDLAKKFNGISIYGEHRFFGKSFPFNTQQQDYDIDKNKYLTSEQALADFVELLGYIKINLSLDNSPIIALGGSYGGMLSAWIRMKFPHLITGAIASSAPLLLFEDPSNEFFKIVTNTYFRYETTQNNNNDTIQCVSKIRNGFKVLGDLVKPDSQLDVNTLNTINNLFKPCTTINNRTQISYLLSGIEDSIVSMAQYNYPYAIEKSNMPKFPAQEMCKAVSRKAPSQFKNQSNGLFTMSTLKSILEVTELGKEISKSLGLNNNELEDVDINALNSLSAVTDKMMEIGKSKCFDISNIDDQSIPLANLNGWSFMACTEMIMPIEKDGVTDMFYPGKFDLGSYRQNCQKTWRGEVKERWIFDFYGGRNPDKDFKNVSNIVFVNGNMDPWLSGSLKETTNPNIKVIYADSAHHLDLRSPNPEDPDSIVDARNEIINYITKWINDDK